MTALEYLLKKEWSMGNGQCPDCCGHPPKWYGHLCNMTTDTIGHKSDCELASSLKSLGYSPLYIGEFRGDVEFETIINEFGGIGTQIKGSNPEARQRALDFDKKFEDSIMDIFFGG